MDSRLSGPRVGDSTAMTYLWLGRGAKSPV